jgi:hypothetical protein
VLAGAHRQGKSDTAGTAASCGARARAPGCGRTGEGGDAEAQGKAV